MSFTRKISNTVRSISEYRAEAQARVALEQELAVYSTPSDRLELEAMIARHPEAETVEVREAYDRVLARTA